MRTYSPPVAAILAALDDVGTEQLLKLDAFSQVDRGTIGILVEEFARFAADVIAPTDAVGDRHGNRLDPDTGVVTTPPGFAEAYRQYVDAGWGALPFPVEHGGGGLPRVVAVALQEILESANLALSLNPVLTQGSIELLTTWGSAEQQARFLPKLLTGEWNGTMNLTEPDAGSDVGALRTTATPVGDGTWRLSGTKIFITWGEHDLTDNIVHLVLARTPGAPAGTKGISLFLVPKFAVGPDGEMGETPQPNGVRCLALEEKVGIHASPTCVLEFDGAIGELIGEENRGMQAMFTMMNNARLSIGLQGLAVSEAAMQQAMTYADERIQGRVAGSPAGAQLPISHHPDVRRMLVTMQSSVDAMRLLLYTTGLQADLAAHGPDEAARAAARDLADLLTPVAKAWSTDTGVELTSLAIQVHGGMGYIEETGVAQHWRDARIAPIYEGTNGIQAIDLVMRKLPREEGAVVGRLLDEMRAVDEPLAQAGAALADTRELLAEGVAALDTATGWLLERRQSHPDDALAGATAYLELFGIVTGGWLLARRAAERSQHGSASEAAEAVASAQVFAIERLSRASGLARVVTAGAQRLGLARD